MEKACNRRTFIRSAALTGISLGISKNVWSWEIGYKDNKQDIIKVGIIGLDTSHSVAFTKAFNTASVTSPFAGFKVAAAYPKGSNDIASSVSRIPQFTKDVENLGVEIVSSVKELIDKSDVVLLETNDGRLHLEQALAVISAGKRMFIDKPVAASLQDVIAIYTAAEKRKVPVFSSSSLRYFENTAELATIGKILGADTYSPATLEKTHPDLFWYGIHGVEMLFTVLGTGCKTVSRVYTPDTDIVVGIWEDGRAGTFRGMRTGRHEYGGTVYGEKAIIPVKAPKGYNALLAQIADFFKTGIPPVSVKETLEIYAFMAAADESKKRNGAAVNIDDVMQKAVR